ncbi:MAG TPA: ATP-binding protein [Xanthobacteraceae bacterium]
MSGLLYDLLHFFDSTELAPHGVCLLWQPGLIWLHVLSDGIIALAYFSIPIVLAAIVAKRPDIDFGWVLWAFVTFITACGATHVFGIWTLWFPDYAAEGAVKGVCALVSILTAIGLWPLLPKILALPSPEQLRRANEGLQRQMDEREAALRALEREKSERRKAEELLRSLEQHREIERLVAVTPDAVIVVDMQGVVQFANEAAVNWLDQSADRLVGHALPFPLKSEEVPQAEIALHDGQRAGELLVADCEWSDGPARLVVIRDITERKRIERLKDEFISTVSHELRTPITSIVGSLGLLVGKAAGNLPEPASRLLAIALKNSQRLTQLVNEILDLSKMESGEVDFRLKNVDIRSVAEQAIEATRGFAASYGVDILLENSSVSERLCVDPDRLVQVVTNLLSNAIKFSPPEHVVVVATRSMRGAVRLSVRDWGPGIPDSFKPQIFEKFAQADGSDARQRGGSGLGLNIVKHIVTRLGGRVSFEDAPGGGTIFYVDLPSLDDGASAVTGAVGEQLAMNLAG